MEKLGLHKQKLYSVIIAAIGIVSCLLPWWHISFGGFGGYGGVSVNGLHKLGIVVFNAFIGAGALPFVMGDKSKEYIGQEKTISLACFGAAAGLAVLTLLTNMKYLSFGIFIAIAAGALGLLLLMGIVKMPKSIDDKIKS
jgi:hypothetical protein